jgi:hypothetical protein
VPAKTDEQVALLASSELAQREQVSRQFHGGRAGGSCGHARGARQHSAGGGACGG